uniref:Potassium channel toxin n=1 Tax=Urodacus yaschenkoi TaxID=1273102 RepID=A0A0A0PJX6_UROYA|nr:potassium channel toxin precursor [Urodacus yaschenkoi]
MNAKLIYLLLVVTTMMLMFDTTQAGDIKCSSTKECFRPCEEIGGCSNAKCINGKCRCYGCIG